jgi:hypothetical protein
MLSTAIAIAAAVLVLVGWSRRNGRPRMEWTDTGVRYKCGRCRSWHEGIPAWHLEGPDEIIALPRPERARRAKRFEDTYLLDGREFFALALLQVPVREAAAEPFVWGVWVALAPSDVERYLALYNDSARAGGEQFEGRLSNEIAQYPGTRGMPIRVHLRAFPDRPTVELLDPHNSLSERQRTGLTRAEAMEVVGGFMKEA